LTPKSLIDTPQWILWKEEVRDGKSTKVPCDMNGHPTPVNRPSSWLTYAEALEALELGNQNGPQFAGIGFCFTADDPFFGVDLDDCLPRPAGDTLDILRRFSGTYAEISPSGQGIKFIGRGVKPEGSRNRTTDVTSFKQLEVYDRDRFFTVTSSPWGLATEVADQQEELDWLCERFLKAPDAKASVHPRTKVGDSSSLMERAAGFEGADEALIMMLRDQEKYERLWWGDTSDYDGDASRADMALLEKIAWLAGPVPERIERIFGQSDLGQREKWVEREDYRTRSIEMALSDKDDFYNGAPAANYGKVESAPAEMLTKFEIPETGIIRDIVDLFGPTIESPDSTIALSALVIMSAFASQHLYLTSGEMEEPLILYVAIIGGSATDKKTTAMKSVRNLFKDAGLDIGAAMSHVSGLALLEVALGGKDKVEFFRGKHNPSGPKRKPSWTEEEWQEVKDEWDRIEQERNSILHDPPPVVIMWDEFGKMLNVGDDWQKDTRAQLLSMYNGFHQGIRTGGKTGIHIPEGKACVSLLATMTTPDFERNVGVEQADDGFLGRILVASASGEDRKEAIPFTDEARPPDYEIKRERLVMRLQQWGQHFGPRMDAMARWEPEARDTYRDWYERERARTIEFSDAGQLLPAALFGRGQQIVKKVATLLALAEDARVAPEHVTGAVSCVESSMEFSLNAARKSVVAQQDRYCDAVEQHIHDSGPTQLSYFAYRSMGERMKGDRDELRKERARWIQDDPRFEIDKTTSGGTVKLK
jgi:hypothetical protein